MKKGRTGGYLMLKSLRKKESEMEKNQEWGAQEKPLGGGGKGS